ncbi:MAG: hypothetical protein ACD_28C00409G0017 [uncultured bacterium]|nr:MAG: hypothetical protein ACD_28C00409G0017 [uncultured bacterium]KKT76562.1 MAG: Glyceraldehyde-3-phosphate dehydrogenase, type I [Candidatus Peregrinibacteria bacterium GW2011_GWA2_44_7]
MKPRVAINGFGRIGRNTFRANLEKDSFEVIAINDLGDVNTLAHLLEYDSLYGKINGTVEVSGKDLVVNGKKIHVYSEKNPADLPWKNQQIDVVLECTGFFTDRKDAQKHLDAGAKKVIVSAPGKEMDLTVVLGVNEDNYEGSKHHILSNASCTTNCLAPVAKVLHENFNILKGLMTTAHSYTNDQRILDLPHEDLRRARAANLSMIPTTTGAAKAVGLVLPELEGKLNGMAIRIPTPTVSIIDLVVDVEKSTTKEEVNALVKAASEGAMKGYLDYSEKPLVSIDYRGDAHSSIVDGLSTMVIGGTMIKIIAWYDNEWGYSNRLVDLVGYMSNKGL